MPFLGLIVAAVIAAVVGGGAYGTYNYYNNNNGRGDNNEVSPSIHQVASLLFLYCYNRRLCFNQFNELGSPGEFDPGDVFNSFAPNGGRFAAAKDFELLHHQLEEGDDDGMCLSDRFVCLFS